MKIRLIALSLLFILIAPVNPYIMLSTKLTCFSEAQGDKSKDCDKTRGFRTCFTRYDSNEKVTGRGCSTKKSSFKECETHSYGEVTEKFCYCTEHHCNQSNSFQPSSLIIVLSLFFILTFPFHCSNPSQSHINSSTQHNSRHLVTKSRTSNFKMAARTESLEQLLVLQ
ncbi:uncharacterized protein LOC111703864 [Eurytemora carolleeae]|uniref:uncharacterized protein LOC111703864 n=1 Tax=Eurytemora carolleeae TaxID=1294199 RepID=UPI000C76C150|nr:uncharacterized protein LOC111703864 [Eurytemora carolleeae]XP_023331708.1 uncharacterized protein LOC111703864 [Eurytemora carolleeae]XP_023331709.1 uncharacterized protein LOC111703864 [Eurytemora carolleeae]|eukprot:XP_023331707.1 uncharacterized protein LOC111703864 [Eurytemora affinis]